MPSAHGGVDKKSKYISPTAKLISESNTTMSPTDNDTTKNIELDSSEN